MKGKNKNIIIVAIVLVVIAMAALVAMRLDKSFDAEKYVASVLEQTYYGEVDGALQMMDGVTEKTLIKQYEDGVTSFVKNSIISGITVDAETEAKFIELGKEIFKAMKFEVVSEEKVSDREYHVTVNYEASDVFVKYVTYVQEESQRINDKVEDGEYKGTVDEINAQIQAEFLSAAYTLLEEAYSNMEYEEAAEIKFVVSAEEDGLYQMNEEELHKFMLKIMKLDQIQD